MAPCLMEFLSVILYCNTSWLPVCTACIDPLSQPHDQSVEPAPKDPVYDVAKKDFANSTPTQNNNKTETPVSAC